MSAPRKKRPQVFKANFAVGSGQFREAPNGKAAQALVPDQPLPTPPVVSGAWASDLADSQQSRPGEDANPEPPESKPSQQRIDAELIDGYPLPRPKRTRNRDKADRGLPADRELEKLAADYLIRQRLHWPELAKRGLLPEPTLEVLRDMVENFKIRHNSGVCDAENVDKLVRLCSHIAGSYCRNSCDNTSPTSIIDQMINILDRARKDDFFLPWEYLYADYSISGLDSSRLGYTSYKAALNDAKQPIERTYIDDFAPVD